MQATLSPLGLPLCSYCLSPMLLLFMSFTGGVWALSLTSDTCPDL